MALEIPAPLVSAGQAVLPVCTRHGEPATRRKKVVFRSTTPAWTYLLILFGVLPFAIVAAAIQKRIKAPAWPFCARCGQLRTRRLLAGIGLVALAVLAIVAVSAALPDGSLYATQIVLVFVLLLIAGLGVAASAGGSSIAAGYASRDGHHVEIRRPHPRFAEEVAAVQQQAAPAQYPPHGYGQPYPAQPYPHQQQPTVVEPGRPDRGW